MKGTLFTFKSQWHPPDTLCSTKEGDRQPEEHWTAEDLRKTDGSHPFNPDIARVFYLRGLMEHLGIGTQRLIAECMELGAKPPVWRVEQGTVALTLFRAPEAAQPAGLTTRQSEFLKRIKPGSEFKVGDYALAAKVSERQARRDLAQHQNPYQSTSLRPILPMSTPMLSKAGAAPAFMERNYA